MKRVFGSLARWVLNDMQWLSKAIDRKAMNGQVLLHPPLSLETLPYPELFMCILSVPSSAQLTFSSQPFRLPDAIAKTQDNY